MVKNVVSIVLTAAVLSVAPAGVEAADAPVGDERLKTADRLIRVGDAGWTAMGVLALVGEARGYDETWVRVGLAAGVGAIVTGIMGRKLKRDVERAGRRHKVSVSLPASGKGVAGAWTMTW